MSKTPTQIRSLARGHTETAINVLVGIMNQPDAPTAARVSAATAILDRGWGKPSQPITGEDGEAIQMVTRIELVAAPLKAAENSENAQ